MEISKRLYMNRKRNRSIKSKVKKISNGITQIFDIEVGLDEDSKSIQ